MYVTIDDELKIAQRRLRVGRLRQRGPAPRLADAEVLTMECAGEFLGLDCDTHVFAYFARHCPHLFPALARTHRTTFARQAANLWHLKEMIWRRLAGEAAPADDRLHIVDSMPVPVCRFARAPFCQRLRGADRYGKDHADRQTFYGFRLHARLTWPGLISEVLLAPANQSEQSLLAPLAHSAAAGCALLGDRNYCGPALAARLAADGQRLVTPPARHASRAPEAARGKKWVYSDMRYLIGTVFGQLTDRLQIKRVRAQDLWHLTSRVYRKVLAHTLALLLNMKQGMEQGNRPLQFERLTQA